MHLTVDHGTEEGASEDADEEGEGVVVVVGTTVDRTRVQKQRNEVTRKESMILNQKKSLVDKEEVTTEEEEEEAEVEAGEVEVIVAVLDLAARGLEMSLELIKMTTMRVIVLKVIETIKTDVREAEGEVIQADVHVDLEDVQDDHQHKVQGMKVDTTVITIVAETNTKTENVENVEMGMTVVVIVETVIVTVNETVMVDEEVNHDEVDMAATEK